MPLSPELGVGTAAARVFPVLAQAPFPLELLDAEGRFVYGNTSYFNVFLPPRTGPNEVKASVFSAILLGSVSRASVFAQALADGLWRSEVILPTASGRQVCFRVALYPVQQSPEAGAGFGVLYEDIQAEVESRDSLVLENNLLVIRSRQAQMGELLSMIAHQWRQPLTVVMSLIGNIQLKSQLGGLESEYLLRKLERISQTVHFLSETIDSFRNFYAPAKYKSQEDLISLTRRALELVGPSLQKNGILIDFQVPEVTVQAMVFAGEWIQVVLELITNARDALASGLGAPRNLRLTVWQDAACACLRVSNNGTANQGIDGTGVGLSLARLIMENHHQGTLTTEYREGWTSFTCSLPQGDVL